MHLATRWAIVTIALTVWAFAGGSSAAGWQQRSPAQLRLDLDRLNDQVVALQAQLGEMGARRDTLVGEFEAADVKLALGKRELELVQARLSILSQEVGEREAEVERLTGDLADARVELAGRVVALYRMGPLSYSRFLFAADNAEEVLANYQIIGRLASQDRSLVASIRARRASHQEAVRAAAETADRLAATREEEALAVQELDAQQELRQELIRQIDIEASAGRRALEEKERSASALEELLRDVSSAPAAATPAGTSPLFAETLGELPWPAEGRIIEKFGRKQHAVYDTYTLVKGIEIAAEAGAPVHAVYRGRVAFADWFQNYGLMVVVSHGEEFFTIYGHLDGMQVRTGETVDEGDVVGTVGETGSLIGPSLYFEVREGTEAVNPELWLRRR